MADEKITIYHCQKHQEWYSNNCSNCMIEANEPEIKANTAKEIYEALAKEWETVKWIGKLPVMHNLKTHTLDKYNVAKILGA